MYGENALASRVYTIYMSDATPKAMAIDILSRRDNSVREMKQKLQKKSVSPEDIVETIEWLQQKKLLNDTTFAKKKAESIYRTKLVGPLYIKMKLKEAGISENDIEDTLYALGNSQDWNDRAQKAIVQWQKIHPKHAQDKVRQMRFLASRGFTSREGV